MKNTHLLAVMTAGLLMLSGCGSTNSEVAMEVGGTKVTTGDMSVLTSQFTSYGGDFETAKKTVSEQIETSLKFGAVGEAMGIQLTDEEKKQVIQMKASYASQSGGLSAYKDYLKKAGSSMEFLEKLFTSSMYQTQVMEKIEAELAEPTDDELKTYYADNYYRAKHILVSKPSEADDLVAADTAESTEAATEAATEEAKVEGEELANQLLERAKGGEDFDAMIKEYTQDPGSESNPDGYIFTDGEMVQEFEDCVKGLQPGEFGICESDYGYHIIQRLPFSKDEAQFETWFTNAKDTISAAYERKQTEDKLEELCQQNNITITVNEDVINGFTEDMVVTPEPMDLDSMTTAG